MKNLENFNSIYQAAKALNEEKLTELKKELGYLDISIANETPLMRLAEKGHWKAVLLLVKLGCSKEIAVQLAALKNKMDIIFELIKTGAPLKMAIYGACQSKNLELLMTLINSEGDSKLLRNIDTAKKYCKNEEYVAGVKKLTEIGYKIFAQIHSTALAMDEKALLEIKKVYGSLDIRVKNTTPLWSLGAGGHMESVLLLVKLGCSQNDAVRVAAFKNGHDVVFSLLKQGAYFTDALKGACHGNWFELIMQLIESRGKAFFEQDLIEAACMSGACGYLYGVKRLVALAYELDPDKKFKDRNHQDLLNRVAGNAMLNHQDEVVRYCLSIGLEPKLFFDNAALFGNAEYVEKMLARQPNLALAFDGLDLRNDNGTVMLKTNMRNYFKWRKRYPADPNLFSLFNATQQEIWMYSKDLRLLCCQMIVICKEAKLPIDIFMQIAFRVFDSITFFNVKNKLKDAWVFDDEESISPKSNFVEFKTVCTTMANNVFYFEPLKSFLQNEKNNQRAPSLLSQLVATKRSPQELLPILKSEQTFFATNPTAVSQTYQNKINDTVTKITTYSP